ncbi:hypothetical protein NL676_007190 [Syzygium grande]|nr:hypothetical protein NL676_007190 [Syzygium grande]
MGPESLYSLPVAPRQQHPFPIVARPMPRRPAAASGSSIRGVTSRLVGQIDPRRRPSPAPARAGPSPVAIPLKPSPVLANAARLALHASPSRAPLRPPQEIACSPAEERGQRQLTSEPVLLRSQGCPHLDDCWASALTSASCPHPKEPLKLALDSLESRESRTGHCSPSHRRFSPLSSRIDRPPPRRPKTINSE